MSLFFIFHLHYFLTNDHRGDSKSDEKNYFCLVAFFYKKTSLSLSFCVLGYLFSLLTYSSPNDCFTHYFSSSLLLLSSDICLSNLFVKFSLLSLFLSGVYVCQTTISKKRTSERLILKKKRFLLQFEKKLGKKKMN